MPRTVKVAALGLGSVGQAVTRLLLQTPTVKVVGVADPYRVPRHDAPLYRWEPALQAPTENLALGRPYLLFVTGDLGPRLLCLGANGTYDSSAIAVNDRGGRDDVVVYLEE